MATTTTTTPLTPSTATTEPSPFTFAPSMPLQISRSAIIWIAILGTLGLGGVMIALFFLFKYSCTRVGREKGQYVSDCRNEHKQWWKHANPPLDANGGQVNEDGQVEMKRLTMHAAPPGLGGPRESALRKAGWPFAQEPMQETFTSKHHGHGKLGEEV
ncbi:hypothetical protein BDV97DRAFT_371350 [Delphinella strobiligena]|nr:hypothetical protein BDV97DRAFT_371350 [Delphinella strobiligena]